MKTFKTSKTLREVINACASVAKAKFVGQACDRVHKLKKKIHAWAVSGEDTETGLFSDDISGEIELCHFGDTSKAERADKNELYTLTDGNGGFVVMTGLEFESIVKQWRSYRKGWK